MQSPNIKYLPAIDHLRAFAATLIVLYHGMQLLSYKQIHGKMFEPNDWIYTNNPISAIIVEGHTAVALFMVLSGFIFTYGAYNNEVNYWSFIKNRLLRIYPLFLLLLFVGIYTYQSNFSYLAFLQTIFLLQNLPGGLNVGPYSGMFWAISVEFQFYLIFPFLIKMFKKHGVKVILGYILLMIVFRFTALLQGVNIRDLTYWTIIGRIDQFLIGMIAAHVFLKTNYSKKIWVCSLIISSLSVLFVLVIFNHLGGWPTQNKWKIIWPSIEGAVWALFLISYTKTFLTNSNFVQRLLSKVGELSFSIYLIHFTIIYTMAINNLFFVFDSNAFRNAIYNTVLVVIPITIIISVLTYNVIEKPFLAMRSRYLK